MVDATIDMLRQEALTGRVKNIGGNRVMWTAKDLAHIRDHIMAMPAETLLRHVPAASRKLFDAGAAAARRKFSELGIVVRDAHPTDRKFLSVISSEDVDHAGDVVTVDGVDLSVFVKNPAVLFAHNSSMLPLAVSTAPVVSGTMLTATTKFPRPGVSERFPESLVSKHQSEFRCRRLVTPAAFLPPSQRGNTAIEEISPFLAVRGGFSTSLGSWGLCGRGPSGTSQCPNQNVEQAGLTAKAVSSSFITGLCEPMLGGAWTATLARFIWKFSRCMQVQVQTTAASAILCEMLLRALKSDSIRLRAPSSCYRSAVSSLP